MKAVVGEEALSSEEKVRRLRVWRGALTMLQLALEFLSKFENTFVNQGEPSPPRSIAAELVQDRRRIGTSSSPSISPGTSSARSLGNSSRAFRQRCGAYS
jgi:hypothetical protein